MNYVVYIPFLCLVSVQILAILMETVSMGNVIAFLASGVLIVANVSSLNSVSLFTMINLVSWSPISFSLDSY